MLRAARRFDLQSCLLCGARGDHALGLCAGCEADLPEAFGGERAILQHRDAIDDCYAAFRYRFPLDGLLQDWKFRGDLAAGRLLSRLFADRLLGAGLAAPAGLLPVPLHWSRLLRRGFNQSTLLAQPLARVLQVPLQHGLVLRARRSAQSGLGGPARARNLRNAFRLAKACPLRHIVIVDDVLTTGATVNALARALKLGGCERVDVWALAQTPLE
jgi:ComF family protein